MSNIKTTVLVSSQRFEESPFIDKTNRLDMVRGVYAGRYFAALFLEEDEIEKYWLLRQKALIFDVPEKPIEISGPDAVPFLEKVLSRRVSNIILGRGYYSIACTPSGGVFMDGILFKLADNRFWYVQADGPFEAWLTAHIDGFDVNISDPKSRVLQIQGPASFEILKAASNGRIDENMPYFRSGYFEIGGQNLYVSRTGFTNELGFEIYTNGDLTDYSALWDHLMLHGEPHGMQFSSIRAMTIRRIEGGILGNLTDMDSTMTPFEAGLGSFIDMDKAHFIGRDALIDKDRRCRLLGLTCKKKVPMVGSMVMDGNRAIGEITAGVPSPTLGVGIGYVRLHCPGDWVGRLVSLRHIDGHVYDSNIVELPFFDKEKLIVKGIDRRIPIRNVEKKRT